MHASSASQPASSISEPRIDNRRIEKRFISVALLFYSLAPLDNQKETAEANIIDRWIIMIIVIMMIMITAFVCCRASERARKHKEIALPFSLCFSMQVLEVSQPVER